MMKNILLAVLFVSVLATTGCSSLRSSGDATQAKGSPDGVVSYALSLQGAPYRFGGTSPAGFDCSGFVAYVYSSTAGVALPHSAEGMYSHGRPVAESELRQGDLVFYNTSKRSLSHVGIYIGNGQFVHATSSNTKRVMISSMSESYWVKRFEGARRIIGGIENSTLASNP